MRRMLSVLCLSLLATTAFSQNLINLKQWKVADGGNDHWYALLDDLNYWEDAMAIAGRLDAPSGSGLSGKGYLATALTAAENSFIASNIIVGRTGGQFSDQFWLGGFDYQGVWIWATNEPMSFTRWSSVEPNNYGKETALAMWGASQSPDGHWNNSFKDDSWALHMKQRAVVEWGAVDSASLVTPASPQICCLRQWKATDGGNNHWYALMTRALIWEDATDAVFQMSAIPQVGTRRQPYLASISSHPENTFILDSVITGASLGFATNRFWIGARHGQYNVMTGKGTPNWLWVSPEPLYWNHWAPGQPGNTGTDFVASIIGAAGTGPVGSSPGEWASSWMNPNYWSVLEWGNPLCGDVDDSKRVNVADVSQFFQWVSAKGGIKAPQNADATGDGTTNIGDAVKLVDFVFRNGGPLACPEW
jgi:hypothetical protein